MTHYKIKPALLRRSITWHVGDDALRRDDRARGPVTLPYGQMTGLRLSRTVFRRQRLERFELTGPWGRETISINTVDTAPASNDDLAAFHRLLVDALPRIADHRPDLPVILAERKGPKWALFSIGIIALLAASLMLVLAIMTAQDRLVAAAVPLGTLFLFGLMISLNARPWRAPASITPGELTHALIRGLEEKPETAKQVKQVRS